jgi:hypothetical protein
VLVDSLFPEIAAELGLRILTPLPGGEFGATTVLDRDGNELVLKAWIDDGGAPSPSQGAELASRMRSRGYPAPVYIASGVTAHVAWSLQERLPGELPQTMNAAHARQLVKLAHLHAGAAGQRASWLEDERPRMALRLGRLSEHGDAAPLAAELAGVIEACGDADLRGDDVVHGDFSQRNFLATLDDVSGIVDWELAAVGDWRFDLVTLDYWAVVQPSRVSTDAASIVRSAVLEACPPLPRALWFAHQALRHLDYEMRVHPDNVPFVMSAIDRAIAWHWRDLVDDAAARVRRIIAA